MTLRRGWRVWPAVGLLVLLALLVAGLAVAGQAAIGQPAGAVVAQQDPVPQPTPIQPPPTEPPAEPSPTLTPAPAPGPPPPAPDPERQPDPGPSPGCGDGGDPALWDVGGQVRQAISEFFCEFVEGTLNSVLETLGESVLATPDLTGNEAIRDVWTANLVIANAVYVLFIVAAGFVVASRETLQTSYGLKEVIPRIVVAGLAANLSLLLVGQGIELANALTAGIAGQGVDPATAAEALTTIRDNATAGSSFLLSLLLIATIVMAIVVLVTFIIRVALLAVLITMAPLALLFHALPQTEQVAFTWWKAVAGCFAIQLGQTVVLVAAVRVFLTPAGPTVLGFPSSGGGWLGILVALAMMWLLLKIPMWVKQYLWLNSRGVVRSLLFAFFLLRTAHVARGRNARGRPDPAIAASATPRRPSRSAPSRSGSPNGAGSPGAAGPARTAAFSHRGRSHRPIDRKDVPTMPEFSHRFTHPRSGTPIATPPGATGQPVFSAQPGTAAGPHPDGKPATPPATLHPTPGFSGRQPDHRPLSTPPPQLQPTPVFSNPTPTQMPRSGTPEGLEREPVFSHGGWRRGGQPSQPTGAPAASPVEPVRLRAASNPPAAAARQPSSIGQPRRPGPGGPRAGAAASPKLQVPPPVRRSNSAGEVGR